MAMATSDSGPASAPLHDAGPLLLLARPGDAVAGAFCRDLLAPHADPDTTSLAVVTDGPRAVLPEPRAGAVVVVGDATRSATAATGPPEAVAGPGAPVETVLVTGDLGTVGGAVDAHLTTRSAAGHRPVVCVDSLTGLLEVASIEATYRFLFVLLRRVAALGAVAHVHADPRPHEEEILRTFFSLFHRVVSVRDGGSVRL